VFPFMAILWPGRCAAVSSQSSPSVVASPARALYAVRQLYVFR
jgi:hypothetical protein